MIIVISEVLTGGIGGGLEYAINYNGRCGRKAQSDGECVAGHSSLLSRYSDIPTQFSDVTCGGVRQGPLSAGVEKREQAPARGAEVAGNPSTLFDTSLGGGATDTAETLTGKRERAPVDEGGGLGCAQPIGG